MQSKLPAFLQPLGLRVAHAPRGSGSLLPAAAAAAIAAAASADVVAAAVAAAIARFRIFVINIVVYGKSYKCCCSSRIMRLCSGISCICAAE